MQSQSTKDFELAAKEFMSQLPYKELPFSKRNWGHPWHSLCSYHGKLKPAIAHHLISTFTQKDDVVLDIMSGVGTIPFEACLQGRIGIGNDLSELAYIVTKAKLERPNPLEVKKCLKELETFIFTYKKEFFTNEIPYKDFGLNKTIPDYFHQETYIEILAARSFFKNRIGQISSSEAFVFSCFLHVLHGNRPYALSRNSHSLTPYAPTGDFIYKNVVEHISNKINLSYKKGDFTTFSNGQAIYGNLFDLPNKFNENVDIIITSPPFVNSITFFKNNWLRLWLTGWEPKDFKNTNTSFIEDKQNKDLKIYTDFFKVCAKTLKSKGKMILHLGKSNKCDMGKELKKLSEPYFNFIFLGNENVNDIQKHGISDKGSTIFHQFLFLEKK